MNLSFACVPNLDLHSLTFIYNCHVLFFLTLFSPIKSLNKIILFVFLMFDCLYLNYSFGNLIRCNVQLLGIGSILS